MNKIYIFLIVFLYSTLSHSIDRNVEVDLTYANELSEAEAIVSLHGRLRDQVDYVSYRRIDIYTEENGPIQEIDITEENSFSIQGSGLYELKFRSRRDFFDKTQWNQNIYLPFDQTSAAEEIAKQYLPLTIYNRDEDYFPQSLEAILSYSVDGRINTVNIKKGRGGDIDLETGSELKNYLASNGHNQSYFNFGTIETTCTIGSFFCDPVFWRYSTGSIEPPTPTVYWDASYEDENLYLTYWYFYSFDPKQGDLNEPGAGSHALDRESVTIRFSVDENGLYTPLEVTYAGHLERQTIEFWGCDTSSLCSERDDTPLLDWEGGKTTLQWENAKKVGKHLVLYKAKGAHAIYPTYGFYKVVNLADVTDGGPADRDFNLIEPAGSVIDPTVITPESYTLQKLDYSTLKYLSFSGDWVDVRILPNAKFPPFVRLPYKSWLLDNNYVFDDCLSGDSREENCSEVNEYFEGIRGLGDLRAVSVLARDRASEENISGAIVRLVASNGSLNLQRTTLSDGRYTFFFTPEEGVTYSVYSFTPDFGEIFCDQFVIQNITEPMANNEPDLICNLDSSQATGQIQGRITDAVTQTPLNAVEVQISQNNTPLQTFFSNTNGLYDIELLTGNYELRFQLEGYIPVVMNIEIRADEVITATELRQISDEYSGLGTVGGVITDAVSGTELAGVTVQVRAGVNQQSGTVINSTTTGMLGDYELDLEAGNYTLEISLNGYVSTYIDVVSIGGQVTLSQNGTISPTISDNELRIILTWGDLPRDLDSHLHTPNIGGENYHVFYSSRGQENRAPYAFLDVDDTSSFGPETITLTQTFSGEYNYSVYNYSGTPSITESQARVDVYNNSGLIRSFNIPSEGEGRYWNVMSINGDTGEITSINEISSSQLAPSALRAKPDRIKIYPPKN